MVSDANFFDLNDNQRKLLKQIFDKFEHPDESILEELVKSTDLNIMIVKAWFKNERKKAKKEQKKEIKMKKKMLKKRNKQNGRGKPSDSSYSDLSDQISSSSSSGNDYSSSSSSSSSSSEGEDSDEEGKSIAKRKEILTEKEKKLLEAFFQKENKTVITRGIIKELAEKLNIRTKLVEDWCRQNYGKQENKNKQNNGIKTMTKNVGSANAFQPSTSFAANNSSPFRMEIKIEQQTIGIGKEPSATSPVKSPFKGNNNHPPTYEKGMQKIGSNNGGVGPAVNIFRIILIVVLLFITMTIFMLMMNSQTKEILENSNQNEQKLFLGITNNKTEGNKNGKVKKRKFSLGIVTNAFDDFEEDEKLYGPEFELLLMENEIEIEQMNIEKLVNEKEFMEKEISEEMAGFRWEFIAKKRKTVKTMNQIIAIFVRAKPIYVSSSETFNFKAKIDFIIKLANSNESTAEYSIIEYTKQCNLNSKNGGKCGFIVGTQNLKKQIALKTGKSIEYLDTNMVAKIKTQFTLYIPATKESIEQI